MSTADVRPNVVLILADDMGYGDFGFVNADAACTPELDDLARSSRVYGQHYSASPVCAPARAALLTGRYPQRTGVIDTLEARGTDRLALDEVTLADALRASGYATGLVGKWHTGAVGDAYAPTARGFDEFVGFRGGWQDYYDWRLERNGAPLRSDGRYLTDVLGDEAVDFIRRHRRDPFFLHVAFNAPHFPFQAPERLVARHRGPGRTERVATIYAMIEAMDAAVGRIRQALDDLGLADDTLVLFTSDNGPDHGGEGEASALRDNAGLAGAKQHVLEGGIRLPLIASWPGRATPGSDDTFVHLTDWYPTILSLTASADPGVLPVDGIDVSASLDGRAVPTGPRFWQWTRYRPMVGANLAMRDGRWKYLRPALPGVFDLSERDEWIDHDIKRHPEAYRDVRDDPARRPAAPPGRARLFDLDADPGELHDLGAQHPDVLQRMEGAAIAWFEAVEHDRARHRRGTRR